MFFIDLKKTKIDEAEQISCRIYHMRMEFEEYSRIRHYPLLELLMRQKIQ